jgi:hypothetical protein
MFPKASAVQQVWLRHDGELHRFHFLGFSCAIDLPYLTMFLVEMTWLSVSSGQFFPFAHF